MLCVSCASRPSLTQKKKEKKPENWKKKRRKPFSNWMKCRNARFLVKKYYPKYYPKIETDQFQMPRFNKIVTAKVNLRMEIIFSKPFRAWTCMKAEHTIFLRSFFIFKYLGMIPDIMNPTPMIKTKKHSTTIRTRCWNESLPTNETSMKDKLLFWKLCKNSFDNCWIEMIHDLLLKWGMYSAQFIWSMIVNNSW